ncbi:uncharacterized protein BJ171DRAFT_513509 [Polychytrium aggregatum]|uniref:uncharacterized protein n=1 Tax=Polychytrium aggregatum TaxID=110093 RepID=UPI0022FDF042|nr:uncharacterized protein BJ171DRAFT_513509 [Polychytrium aggregatum]KAI9202599.1 hypothetical protein BJ171DRAFT_513509 [Polychytrium aggregatum]
MPSCGGHGWYHSLKSILPLFVGWWDFCIVVFAASVAAKDTRKETPPLLARGYPDDRKKAPRPDSLRERHHRPINGPSPPGDSPRHSARHPACPAIQPDHLASTPA